MRYLAQRALLAIPTALLAVVLVFVAIRVLPNNPALARFGQHAVPEQVAAEMARQGWDQPIWKQLGRFLAGLVSRGELGQSLVYPEESVAEQLARRFPATVELALAAMLFAVPGGLLLGIAAAVWHRRWPDMVCVAGSLVGISVPVFFLGILLMWLFPGVAQGGRLPVGTDFPRSTEFIVIESLLRGRWDILAAALQHLLLPALALSTIPAALLARITRAAMLETLDADFVRTARAKGASPRRVVLRHAWPNAALPVANIGGLQMAQLLSGAVLTESVFDWPGLGRLLVQAVMQSDYNVVQGATLLVAVVFVVVNLSVDALLAWLDPRVRLGGGR